MTNQSSLLIEIPERKGSEHIGRHRRFMTLVIISLVLLNLSALIVQMSVGEYGISFFEIIDTLLNPSNDTNHFILLTLRLPRALIAFLVGCGLAISGAIIQSITRNALASSGTLGVNSGASLAAVLMIVTFPSLPITLLPVVAFIGGMLAVTVTYIFGWRGSSSPIRLILVGIGVGTFCGALVSMTLVFGEIHLVSQATIWISGSIYARSWEEFTPLFIWLLLTIPITISLFRLLDVTELGRDIAKGLGSAFEWDGLMLILLSVWIASACVATAGAIGFVGLMSPHIGRKIVGSNHKILLPVCTLIGGLIVQVSDIAGRILFTPYEIPCGVITAAIGAPFMIYLLIKK